MNRPILPPEARGDAGPLGALSGRIAAPAMAAHRPAWLTRTKLFMIGSFLPTWISSLMMWGDDHTSMDFEAAPRWFYLTQTASQLLLILFLFFPSRIKLPPSLFGVFLCFAIAVSLTIASPTVEGEFILVKASYYLSATALVTFIFKPNARVTGSDLAFLFYLMLAGFAVQGFLYLAFGKLPSHSITDLLIRFNGITNDSLSTGFLVPVLIPWASRGRHAAIKILILIGEAAATGSFFSAIFTPIAVIVYLIGSRRFRTTAMVGIVSLIAAIYSVGYITDLINLKLESTTLHLRLFSNLTGTSLGQTSASCSQQFCESFLESGFNLSPVYAIAFYGLLLYFLAQLFSTNLQNAASPLMRDTLRIYGTGLLVGTFVHPVPIIPFAVPLFMILTTLHLSTSVWRLPSSKTARIVRSAAA